jgi:hypothetical protein
MTWKSITSVFLSHFVAVVGIFLYCGVTGRISASHENVNSVRLEIGKE